MKKIPTFLGLATICVVAVNCKKNGFAEEQPSSKTITASPDYAVVAAVNDSRYFDFESASIAASPDFSLTDNGYTARFITKGTHSNPLLTTTEHYKGSTSIVYQMGHTSVVGSVNTDKSQHRIFSGNEDLAMGFGDKRYYGFAVKIDNSTDQPSDQVQLFQIWQGGPMSPPVELVIIPGNTGSTIKLELRIRNNSTTGNPHAGIPIYTGSIQKGVWVPFVLMAIMQRNSDPQNGEIKLWQNNSTNPLVDWFGRVGYDNGVTYGGNPQTPGAKFDVFFGPYRPCQQKNVKFFYDQVRYATTYAQANPNQ